ncbi:MAG: dethiobiotin synthase [Candidatus Caenarcaniphilales bacterium]|nr:dethiobiotin synthase [Candidatus Caenarcaniphilales bacterium]
MTTKTARTLLVTGTDTEIGKTFTTALLGSYLVNLGFRVTVFKPIQTGCTRSASTKIRLAPDLSLVKRISPEVHTESLYNLELPGTPSLAAQKEGIVIELSKILTAFKNLSQEFDYILVEGAGGLFVPITPDLLMVDLLHAFGAPALLVSRNQLGTINHTGLSIKYGLSRGLSWSGFVFSPLSPSRKSDLQVLQANATIIDTYTGVPFLGQIPYLETDHPKEAIDLLARLNPLSWFESKI